jgi:hypothetical protein
MLRDALKAGTVLFIVVVMAMYAVPILFARASVNTGVQDRVHTFLYAQQPQTVGDFVAFAKKEIRDAQPQQILDAVNTEGDVQTAKGHPSAVGVLSMMALSYADAYSLSYSPDEWQARQNRALQASRTSNVQLTDLWAK